MFLSVMLFYWCFLEADWWQTEQNGVIVWPNASIWMRDELRSKVLAAFRLKPIQRTKGRPITKKMDTGHHWLDWSWDRWSCSIDAGGKCIDHDHVIHDFPSEDGTRPDQSSML